MAKKRKNSAQRETPAPSAANEQRSEVAEENVRAVAHLRRREALRRSLAQQISDAVSVRAGSGASVVIHVVWFCGWIIANIGVLPITPFDPFPFGLLTMIVSLEAIFLSLFVLASQSRMTQEADRREDLDLQVDMLAEQEMTLVLQMLEEICDHLGLEKTTRSRIFRDLAKPTNVPQLAERVEEDLNPRRG